MTLKNNYHIMTLNENDTNSEPYSVCPSTVIFDSTELKSRHNKPYFSDYNVIMLTSY